jgi:hypothetical protein
VDTFPGVTLNDPFQYLEGEPVMNKVIRSTGVTGFFAVILTSLTLLSGAAFAQQTTGNVRGLIKDPTGAVVASAKVTILDKKTNNALTTQSTSSGEYEFKNLPIGDYQITVETEGFKKVTLTDVRVQLNQTTDIGVNLEVGVRNDVVEVSAGGAELVDTTTTNLAKGFSAQQVTDLAQTGTGAGIYNLALIAPNVSTSGGVGVGVGGSVGGQRPRNNNFVVDGIDNNDKSITGPQVYISPDSVAEFSLLQNQYSAEFARSTGGQFITITKSGTNQYHGTAYGNFRNRHLNALDTLQKAQGITRCTTIGDDSCNPRNDIGRFGFNVGGPLYLPRFGQGGRATIGGKDKLFFFAGYERSQNGSAVPPGAVFTPTAAGFATLSSMPGLSATNLAIFKQYVPPAPSASDSITVNGVSIPVGQVAIPAPSYGYNHYVVTNIDFNQSEKTQHRARFNFNRNRAIDIAATLPVFYQLIPTDTRLFSYTLTHTFTPKLNNELRLAYRRSNQTFSVGNFSFPGLDSFPNIGLGELGVDIGPDGNAPQFTVENNYQLVNNLSYLTGAHSTKFGGDFRKIISPQQFVQRSRGDYQYRTVETFLLDRSPEVLAERSVGFSPYYGDQKLLFLYGQDDWRIRPNFTLNLGVNYAYQELPFGARQQSLNQISSVPGLISFGEPAAQKKNFAPRIGFAYSPNFDQGLLGRVFGASGKSAIRAGFSMAYDVIFDNLYILSPPPQFSSTVDVDAGVPNFLASGGIPGVYNPITNAADARAATSSFIQDQQVPYSVTYTLSYQRQFAQNWSFETRYLGTRGVHLPTQNRINRQNQITDTSFIPTFMSTPTAAQLAALPTLGQLRAARPSFVPVYTNAGFASNIVGFLSNGNSTYHGFSTQVNRRLANGWLGSAAYTWSHFIDDTTAEVFSTVLSARRVQDFRNLQAEKADSALDHRHRFVLSSIYNLPFFTNSQNRFARSILGGFALAGTLSFESGEKAGVLSGIDSNLNGDAAGDRTILNPKGQKGTGSLVTPLNAAGAIVPLTTPTGAPNPAIVAYVADNPNAQYIQAGYGARSTAGRNTLQLPGINNLDFSIFKNFAIYEDVKIQFRADMYNAFNHAQFVPGSVNGVEATSQTSTAVTNLVTVGRSGLFNRPDQVFTSHPRVIQLALRLNF